MQLVALQTTKVINLLFVTFYPELDYSNTSLASKELILTLYYWDNCMEQLVN